jgi:divalent metal cation (Fe/Co/Zn/Cd) transporter
MTRSFSNINVQKLVLTTSIALFCIKLIAWYITDSVAVYTDALESIVNVVSGAFGL